MTRPFLDLTSSSVARSLRALGVAVVLVALPSLVGCGGAPSAAATTTPKRLPAAPPTTVARGSNADAAREAGAALDAWHDAATRSDEEAYFTLLDEEGVFLGTDATERWAKPAFRAYAHEPFAAGRGWSFKPTRRALQVTSDGDFAFFDEDLTSPRFAPVRGSGVLVRRAAGWRVLQYVLSLTIPNDRLDAVKEDATAKIALAPEGKLAPLSWLSGTWAGSRDDLSVELTWSQARAGTLVGTLRVSSPPKGSKPGETQSIDALRIESSDKATVYTAERKGRAALRYEAEPAHAPTGQEPKGSWVSFVDPPSQVKLTFSFDAGALQIVVERKGKVEETTLLQRAVIVGHE